MKNFTDLTEREVLAVAISSEEEDGLCLPKIKSEYIRGAIRRGLDGTCPLHGAR